METKMECRWPVLPSHLLTIKGATDSRKYAPLLVTWNSSKQYIERLEQTRLKLIINGCLRFEKLLVIKKFWKRKNVTQDQTHKRMSSLVWTRYLKEGFNIEKN